MTGRRSQPVLVLPGFGASDRSTVGLRTHLALRGHPVHRWRLGRNEGPTSEIIDGLSARFLRLAERHGQPIAIVGWSLGGVYAWALARQYGAATRSVVTLGSPLRANGASPAPPAVPVTSIWSRRDGVVPWQRSMIDPGPRQENVEVRATHITLGFDPLVLAAVADRVARRPDEWRPFRPPPWLGAAYP